VQGIGKNAYHSSQEQGKPSVSALFDMHLKKAGNNERYKETEQYYPNALPEIA